MNRNTESYFSQLPNVDVNRSIFDLSHDHKTSFNVGELIPFFWTEILPGDTFKVTTSYVARLQTLLTPIMDNMYIDTYYFFVPMRLCWNHTKEFYGENTVGPWIPETEYTMPLVSYPESGWNIGTVADYMGIPTNVYSETEYLYPISLPFRAYALICNEWFRNQNVSDPLHIPVDDVTQAGSNGDFYVTDVVNGGKPFKVAKYHDYFTSCLPSPQKGPSVDAGFGDFARVITKASGEFDPPPTSLPPLMTKSAGAGDLDNRIYSLYRTSTTDNAARITYDDPAGMLPQYPVNLFADLSPVNPTINELRLAFQLQKFYEKNARGGTRMREMILEHFGVTSSDARMMVPEYLGGHRVPLSIHQVANQSQGETDFLGDLGAMSNTTDVHDDFIQSFTEPGYLIGVCCVRYDHSYPQGLHRAWTRRRLIDHYFPVFANIGEKPVFKYELDLVDEKTIEPAVFGYQEAWAEYRYMPNRVSGEMRSGHDKTLDSWHLADHYSQVPSLSDSWIREDKANVDRVLAVQSSVANQVFCDFYVNCQATRPMPVHSIPGLIDHH